MFSYLDFLFKEEKSKNSDAKIFGITESYYLQERVRVAEIEGKNLNHYDDEDIKLAIVHARQDIILLVAMLSRVNILLRWIRFILVLILLVLLYKI